MRFSVRTLVLVAALFATGSRANAQAGAATQEAGSGILRGTVTSAAGGPLAYAVVTIVALGVQQFSNAQGKFYFTKIPAGKHRVTIRQLGYQAATIEVVLGPNGSEDVAVQLQRIATRLATMQVLSEWRCTQPGAPAKQGGDLALLAVFEQLEQNAVRLKLLMKEYPFDQRMERRRILQRTLGPDSVERIDTTRTLSSDKSSYEVGQVVRKARLPNRSEQYFLQVPTLLDFAQEEFQKNHCFLLRGIDTTKAVPLIRVDFKAAAKIKEPDVEGTVFLDTATYRLRQTEIRLTKIPPDVPGLVGLKATTFFDDVVPGMPVTAGISAVSEMRPVRGFQQFQRAIENQHTVSLSFLKKRPDAVPPPDP